MLLCPRCKNPGKPTGKEWNYSVFHVKQIFCGKCNKRFQAYYKEDVLWYTIPKQGPRRSPKRVKKKTQRIRVKTERVPIWKRVLDDGLTVLEKQQIYDNKLRDEIKSLFEVVAKRRTVNFKRLFYAASYFIGRKHGLPVMITDFTHISGISKKELAKSYSYLRQKVNIKIPIQNPEDIMMYRTNLIKLPTTLKNHSIQTLKKILEITKYKNKTLSPASLAALATFYACKKNKYPITKKEIGELFQISTATITNNLKLFKPYIDDNSLY